MNKCGSKCGGSKISWILVIIGALNWGLVGVGGLLGYNWNVVELIFGRVSWLESIIYILVGLAGIIMLFGCRCKKCTSGSCGHTPAPEMPNNTVHHEG